MPLWKYFFFVFSFWNFANVFGMVFFRFIIFEKNLFLSFDKFGTFAVIISLSTFSVQPSFFSLSESDDTNIRYFVIVSQVPESQFIFFFQSFFFSFRLDISFFFPSSWLNLSSAASILLLSPSFEYLKIAVIFFLALKFPLGHSLYLLYFFDEIFYIFICFNCF